MAEGDEFVLTFTDTTATSGSQTVYVAQPRALIPAVIHYNASLDTFDYSGPAKRQCGSNSPENSCSKDVVSDVPNWTVNQWTVTGGPNALISFLAQQDGTAKFTYQKNSTANGGWFPARIARNWHWALNPQTFNPSALYIDIKATGLTGHQAIVVGAGG